MVNRTLRRSGLPALILVASLAAPLMGQYIEHDLVSDIPHLAPKTNSNVVNPWGIASTPSGPFWISDNGAGVSTVLMGNGNPFPDPNNPLVITIPLPGGGPGASPTGVVFNSFADFVVSEGGHSGPAAFIFATEDGTISAWNPNVDVSHALLKVDNSTNATDGFHLGAVYKGIAIGHSGSGNFIYATNFRDGVVEMYDGSFHFVKAFTDPSVTPDATSPGFAPFGIRNINGKLFVTFAKQNGQRHDDVAGTGSGFVDMFDLDGTHEARFATGGALNSPWGLALAPANFGPLSNSLLVGNFGDGRINAFNPGTGASLGPLVVHGQAFSINGLWGLTFGNGGLAGDTNVLFFTAGINDESDGLFGRIEFGQ